MLEAQFALIESLNKPIVNEFRIPRSTMEPQRNQPIPTFNLQDQPERQNAHQSFRFWQNLQTNLNVEQDEKNNEQSSDFSTKILYVGNLSPVVTEEDLDKLLVLRQLVTSKKPVKLNYLCVPKRVILDVLLM